MQDMDPYRPRAIRFLDLWEIDGWRLKAYGIAYGGAHPDRELTEAARTTARNRLHQSGALSNHYGVGFVGVHEGKTGNFVFVDWWADENELHHHVYVSPSHDPAALGYQTPTGLAACVWDLALIGHERDAWVASVLRRPTAPDLEAYLATRLSADV